MKKTTLITLSLLLATTLLTAGGHGGGNHKGNSQNSSTINMGHGLFTNLSLTTDQLTEIRALKTTLKTNIESLAIEQAIKSAVVSGNFDADIFKAVSIANHTQVTEYIATYE